ncbi:hypothetical protein [Aurantiacibacter luteus]|uniref:hypothetical protein n=1 Tax=Aurantiacibacter luteus TaxID=1581420 RepID=UPI001F4C602C|nr:hypothetical protein [Aurantiacibacter luteus]
MTEYAVTCETGNARRVLIVPPLFDEHNKLRHFLAETMRALATHATDSVLPDLPGTNESLAPLEAQTLAGWRQAVASAASQLGATHLLAVRGGALVLPGELPALACAPVSGPAILRGMIRARVIADREAGRESEREALLAMGRSEGIELAGYRLGAGLLRELESAEPAEAPAIAQADLGGAGLWLRAEPAHDPAQSLALARIVAERLA